MIFEISYFSGKTVVYHVVVDRKRFAVGEKLSCRFDFFTVFLEKVRVEKLFTRYRYIGSVKLVPVVKLIKPLQNLLPVRAERKDDYKIPAVFFQDIGI